MPVTSRLQYFRVLFLVFFISLLFRLSSADLKVAYTCYKKGTDPYIAVFVEIGNVFDIYGKGAELSCGLRALNMTGKGDALKPYRLNVNLTGVGDVNPGVCGVVKKGNLVNLTIVIRTENGTLATGTEREAKIYCDFSNVVVVNSNWNMNFVEQKAVEENPNITLSFDGSPSELIVGTETFLVMRMWTLNHFAVIESFKCWAMRNPTDPNKILLSDNYCPVSTAPIALNFKHKTRYSAVQSDPFKVFRFFDSDVLLIRCLADICFNQEHCVQISCPSRKKRSVANNGNRGNKRYTANVDARIIIRDGTFSKVFNGTQLPFLGTIVALSIITVILIATIVSLVLRFYARKISR